MRAGPCAQRASKISMPCLLQRLLQRRKRQPFSHGYGEVVRGSSGLSHDARSVKLLPPVSFLQSR
jgi:hypothetical protein